MLDETQKAIEKMLAERGSDDPAARALRHRQAMEAAFEDARVAEFKAFECVCPGLPDPNDTHVVAAALKTQAAIIVTENLSDFPKDMLAPLGLEVRSADAFIADTVALETDRAVAAIRRMRERLKKPEKTADARYGVCKRRFTK